MTNCLRRTLQWLTIDNEVERRVHLTGSTIAIKCNVGGLEVGLARHSIDKSPNPCTVRIGGLKHSVNIDALIVRFTEIASGPHRIVVLRGKTLLRFGRREMVLSLPYSQNPISSVANPE